MANIIPPRRGEPITDASGVPTLRFFEYLELSASQSNDSLDNTEVDIYTVNMSAASIGSIVQRLDDMDVEMNITPVEAGRV